MNRRTRIRMSPTGLSVVLLTLSALLMVGPVSAQKLYKWVDKDGNVHYSDQVPPDQVEQAREQLNEHGVVVDRVDRALTAEERQALEELLQRQRMEAEQREQQRRDDAKLLASYSSEADIRRSRDQQVSAIDRSVEAARAYIAGQSKSLAGLMERAAQTESQGGNVSGLMQDQIADLREQIGQQETFIEEQEAEKARIISDFNALIDRYRIVKDRNEDEQEATEQS